MQSLYSEEINEGARTALLSGRQFSVCSSKTDTMFWLPQLAKNIHNEVEVQMQNGRNLIQNRDYNGGHNDMKPQQPFCLRGNDRWWPQRLLRIKLNNAL